MARRGEDGIDEMLARAQEDAPSAGKRPGRDKRYIYNGDTRTSVGGYAVRPNKRGVRKRISTFTIILSLFGFGIAIVLYVNNIITVNQLAYEVDQLQAKYNVLLNVNASLQAEVNRKSAWERIGATATQQLGLHYPTEQPQWFSIDREKLDQLEGR